MCILKYYINKLIYKIKIDSQTSKTNIWVPKRKGGREINRSLRLTDAH